MRHLIVFSHLRWGFVRQRPQHLLSRLARSYKVLLVEEPVASVDSPWLERITPQPGVDVLRVHMPGGGRGFGEDPLGTLQDLLHDHLELHDITDYVTWFYTPMAFPLLERLNPKAVVYDCIDDLSASRNAAPQWREREAALLDAADLVFTGGPSLYEAKRERHPQLLCLPSAVDAKHFSRERALADVDAMRRAGELQGAIAQPRLGFYGVIDERLDLGLIDRLAAADPSWQLVMVGPVVGLSPDALPRRPNIHWLGAQPYELLPQLAAGWDVCLLPFVLNESTRFINPIQTLEYMAAERPIVSTPVRDVTALYGEDLRLAEGKLAFVQACRDALAESPEQRLARIRSMLATVGRYSWNNTADTIRHAIDAAIARREALELRAA